MHHVSPHVFESSVCIQLICHSKRSCIPKLYGHCFLFFFFWLSSLCSESSIFLGGIDFMRVLRLVGSCSFFLLFFFFFSFDVIFDSFHFFFFFDVLGERPGSVWWYPYRVWDFYVRFSCSNVDTRICLLWKKLKLVGRERQTYIIKVEEDFESLLKTGIFICLVFLLRLGIIIVLIFIGKPHFFFFFFFEVSHLILHGWEFGMGTFLVFRGTRSGGTCNIFRNVLQHS